MKIEKIVKDQNIWIDRTAELCGDVAVGCTETVEILNQAGKAADDMRVHSDSLAATITKLEEDTSKVAAATKKASAVSAQAREMLESGEQTIQMSTQAFGDIVTLIDQLGEHITGFASAMDQVRSVSQSIDGIAKTTNMLALNASIEAAKAGESGRSFAVVAEEVKKLASNSRSAAVEITQTVNSLSDEAAKFVSRINDGKADSANASEKFDGLQQLLGDVAGRVKEVGEFNDGIADSTSAVHSSLINASELHEKFNLSAEQTHRSLEAASEGVRGLENNTNSMFDNLAHSGLSQNDQPMVDIALAFGAEIIDLTQTAIANGDISPDEIFDTDYKAIPGSNPPRFTTGLTKWADDNWRPALDRMKVEKDNILSVICSDMNGFLPTHRLESSQEPTGDIAHDTRFCRNGRIILGDMDSKARASEADFMMGVYSQKGDGVSDATVRNVYVPLRFNGRRWGDFELAYVI